MFSSAELIEALRRRARRSLRPERPPGTFPEGWSAWFASISERIGAVTGATADAILQIMLQREPALPPRAMLELNRWQSFNTLWRQQWYPASGDERGMRWIAIAITAVIHLILVIVLVWLAYIRFIELPTAAPEGDNVVQVEYIGQGTPIEQGGGPPQAEVARQTDASSAAASAQAAISKVQAPQEIAQATPQPDTTTPPAANPDAQPPQEPAPSAAQPLQATEVAIPDTTFTVPPPSPRVADLAQAQIIVPALRTPTREVELREVMPPVPVAIPKLPQREIAVPEIRQRVTEVQMREVATPLPQVRPRNLPPTALASPQLRTQAPRVSGREIPMPAEASGSGQAASGTQAAASNPGTETAGIAPSGSGSPSGADAPGGNPAARSGTQPAGSSAGSGPATTPRPGAATTPRRGTDLGASNRNRPGGQAGGRTPGLFNPDGSVRLPSGDGRVGGGLPPGTITEDYEKIDRMGTWLKRPPIDYTPSRFDKFWVPRETLLEEWVRRSIKEVLIPVPGTSKKIRCVVSLLQLGGGCTITDPNLQDQEAEARKPPDIPFKPELQEDQGSLKK